jgi:hypothetical protein
MKELIFDNQDEIQISILGLDPAKLTKVMQEIYDRLARLGYKVSYRDGKNYGFVTKQSDLDSVYIETVVQAPIKHL